MFFAHRRPHIIVPHRLVVMYEGLQNGGGLILNLYVSPRQLFKRTLKGRRGVGLSLIHI